MIRQFKMTNGEEIICKILSEPEGESDEMIVNNCLKLYRIDMSRDVAYHSFRPWMFMKDDLTDAVSINTYHIVAATIPSKEMQVQYKEALYELKLAAKNKETYSLEDFMNKFNNLQNEDKRAYDFSDDSDGNKVIDFNSAKDKLH